VLYTLAHLANGTVLLQATDLYLLMQKEQLSFTIRTTLGVSAEVQHTFMQTEILILLLNMMQRIFSVSQLLIKDVSPLQEHQPLDSISIRTQL
jgi:hypothetical protein